jgi:hypothetical protein
MTVGDVLDEVIQRWGALGETSGKSSSSLQLLVVCDCAACCNPTTSPDKNFPPRKAEKPMAR